MKFSLDGLKNANWKQLAVEHGEKAGLVVATLVAAVILYSGPWTRFTEKDPTVMDTQLGTQEKALQRSSWSEERQAEDLPEWTVGMDVDRMRQPVQEDDFPLPYPFSAPIYPPEQPGGEPTWLPVEQVLTYFVALPVRLAPEDALSDAPVGPAGDEPGEPAPSGDFIIPAPGGGQFGFPTGGFDDDEEGGGPPPRRMMRDEGEEGGFLFGGDEEGGMFGGSVESDARGRGLKAVVITGVFPYRRQVQEMARIMNVSFAEAKARLEFLDLQIERQRAVAGPKPWSEDWEPVDREAAEDLLGEDLYGSVGQSVEVVSPALTDPVLTMPLFTRGYGTWDNRPEATHPRIKQFDISSESPELKAKIEAYIKEREAERKKPCGRPAPARPATRSAARGAICSTAAP